MKNLVITAEQAKKKSEHAEISPGLSCDIVRYLRQNNRTLAQIGELTGSTKSFISRVAKGERNFTVQHLLRLEKALRQPLPLLLIDAINEDSLSKEMRKLYRSLRKSLELSGRLRAKVIKSSK